MQGRRTLDILYRGLFHLWILSLGSLWSLPWIGETVTVWDSYKVFGALKSPTPNQNSSASHMYLQLPPFLHPLRLESKQNNTKHTVSHSLNPWSVLFICIIILFLLRFIINGNSLSRSEPLLARVNLNFQSLGSWWHPLAFPSSWRRWSGCSGFNLVDVETWQVQFTGKRRPCRPTGSGCIIHIFPLLQNDCLSILQGKEHQISETIKISFNKTPQTPATKKKTPRVHRLQFNIFWQKLCQRLAFKLCESCCCRLQIHGIQDQIETMNPETPKSVAQSTWQTRKKKTISDDSWSPFSWHTSVVWVVIDDMDPISFALKHVRCFQHTKEKWECEKTKLEISCNINNLLCCFSNRSLMQADTIFFSPNWIILGEDVAAHAEHHALNGCPLNPAQKKVTGTKELSWCASRSRLDSNISSFHEDGAMTEIDVLVLWKSENQGWSAKL